VPERSVELAEKAVSMAAATDWTVQHADALLCLRDVLLAAGRVDEAERAGEQAAPLYRAKGHLVGLHRVENPTRIASSESTGRTVAGGT
jgi:hypothetical protein